MAFEPLFLPFHGWFPNHKHIEANCLYGISLAETDATHYCCYLLLYILVTSKVISGWVLAYFMTVHAHGDFNVLPLLKIKPPAP